MSLDIGIIGCGAIAQMIIEKLNKHRIEGIRIRVLFDRNIDRVDTLSKIIHNDVLKTNNINDLYRSEVALVVECASQDAVREYADSILTSNKDLMVLSVGALLNKEFYEQLVETAEKHSKRIYIPSGAVAGIDVLKAAALDTIYYLKLITSKNPKNIEQTKYLDQKGIILENVTQKTLLFSGSAKDAVFYFPKNINVAGILSLSGLGMKETIVEIYADPSIEKNIHEIEVMGEFGKMTSKVENVSSPLNPKTSYLAALSAVKKLIELSEIVSIGT